jgi:hypothetical protein
MLLATGSIHPESGGWYLDEPVELRYADGHWTIIIRDSQFHVVVDGQPPEDLATFRNEVDVVPRFVDLEVAVPHLSPAVW